MNTLHWNEYSRNYLSASIRKKSFFHCAYGDIPNQYTILKRKVNLVKGLNVFNQDLPVFKAASCWCNKVHFYYVEWGWMIIRMPK